MKEKERMIETWLSREFSITEVAEMYGVSRKTIHKWVGRFKDKGRDGLEDWSRAPLGHPNATSGELVANEY